MNTPGLMLNERERERERGNERMCCNDQTKMLTPLRTIFRCPSNAVDLMQQRCSEARDPPTSSIEGASVASRVADEQSQSFTFSSGGAGESETSVFVSSCRRVFSSTKGSAESTVHIFSSGGVGGQQQVCLCLRAFVSSCLRVRGVEGGMDRWMDGWVDGWMGGWMGGWMYGWMGGRMGGWLDGCMVGCMGR